MWKPATRQITGTNDGTFHCLYVQFFGNLIFFYFPLVPLGQRRRFGPAPAEDGPAPQLAQPSPSAYPRSQHQDESPGKRGRDESPVNGDPKGKHETIICPDFYGFATPCTFSSAALEVVCKFYLYLGYI